MLCHVMVLCFLATPNLETIVLYVVLHYRRTEEPVRRKAAFYTVVLLVATHKRPRNAYVGRVSIYLSYIKGSPLETPMLLLHPKRSQILPLQYHTSA